jgi:hypothetical protein
MLKKLVLFLLCLFFSSVVWGGPLLTSPEGFEAIDKPNDSGKSIVLTWKKMAYEDANVTYTPMISESKGGPYIALTPVNAMVNFRTDMPAVFGYKDENKDFHAVEVKGFKKPDVDGKTVRNGFILSGNKYYFVLKVQKGSESAISDEVSVVPEGNWFACNKTPAFIMLVFLTIVILSFIAVAKRNTSLFIRRIAGLEAMDDALGRATEMGKSVLFAHGLKPISEVSTIAAINILGEIAKKVAEFDTGLKVANWDPIIQQVSQETVKEAYTEVGRPDAYKEENVYIAAYEQFSYAAAVEGLMVREEPAANFYFGYFYAESLLLTETGNSTGAIQIAGTDAFTQIPFFITTCDYTLIGEELYAASAYLSREPRLLGSLKGQDVGKAVIILIIILGTLFSTFGWEGFARLFWIL